MRLQFIDAANAATLTVEITGFINQSGNILNIWHAFGHKGKASRRKKPHRFRNRISIPLTFGVTKLILSVLHVDELALTFDLIV